MKQLRQTGGKLLPLLPLLLLAALLLPRLSGLSVAEILAYTPAKPLWAALALVGLYALKALTMVLPAVALNLCVGLLFPLPAAILVGLAGHAAELSLGYGLGRLLGRERVLERLSKNDRVARFLAGRKRHDAASCFLSRLVLPVEPCSLFFGAIGIPFGRYLFFSTLGRLPPMLLGIFAGTIADNPGAGPWLLLFAVGITLAAGLPALVYQLRRRDAGPVSLRRFLDGEE